ncbi:bleomycin resistance protein [Bordetella avium]|uniref:Bleomycin resistance protein n=1 Tax=Bordetella avium (strain 197N) TaxID=360910 RepID=Q2KYB5_BORA1|nr:VOC family protein [Bordetella avium]AZY49659.1 VOC family protein [Bordetella avium]AZY53012.1 VOC family protein [Bordetella avium]RIQ12008.1 VOC family protein [Bordetella avium]RIQ17685.1 VOC family protein [Bordetella avium]RIQ32342.1 VOC family protein [Bordetella avium]
MAFRGAKLVPELLVRDISASLGFWVDTCGFSVAYERRDEGFVYLDLDGAQIMLEELGHGRNWITSMLDAPLGRGVNFQVAVSDVQPLLVRLRASGCSLFMEPEDKWYRRGGVESGVRQFLVQDPDGYLIRFQASLGSRSVSG